MKTALLSTPLLATLCAAMAATALLVRAVRALRVMDVPVARSSHSRPIPKGGGIGILGGVVLFAVPVRLSVHAGWFDIPFAALLAAGLGLGAVSWLDDLHSYPARYKLGAQAMAALLATCGIVMQSPGWLMVLGGVAGFIWLMTMTNALNFIDGLNGLCSGSMALCAAVLSLTAFSSHTGPVACGIASLLLLLACCLLAFLPFNFPRARIFMGDVGSQGAGMILSGGALALAIDRAVPSVLAPCLLSGILFDVVFTLARRTIAGNRLAQAHRGHLYQIAVRCGVSPVAVALLHWTYVAWGAIAALLVAPDAPWRALALVAGPQLLWSVAVCTTARRKEIGPW